VTFVVLVVVATLSPDASADSGFWRSSGLHGVDAFGVYRARPARVRLSFLLKDLRKDGYSAAVRFTFTERHHRRSVHFRALHGDRAPARWRAVRSANTGHLYVQECVGTWRKKGFRIRRCGHRRRRY
jgi:hypothetical protein